ncbi:hypothetical protein [Methylobacterium planeticum]|uniref:Nitrate reductase n=1 Tax=Methylobacterium planeticum TaxID=2615211 RepID=A0A6N6MTC8_9HYPH|nr:hypothetical protein [Methylobacterium planeticum]KAB1075138.1 hypothetical protein F6X51_04420 [Methylobacterium planeticum]
MPILGLKAWRARTAAQAAACARLKADLAAGLALGDGDALHVNAVACPDPGCPDTETVVLVMRAGRPTRALRLRKAPGDATQEDVRALAAEEAEPAPR